MLKIASFELRYMLKSPQTFVTFGLFFLMAFFAMSSDAVQIGAGGNVLINSPYAIMQTLLLLNIFTLFAVPSFIGNSALKDFDHKFDGILFATPMSKPSFLAGRFIGSFIALNIAASGALFGMLLGTFYPGIDPETLAPTNLGHYAQVFFVYVVPVNLALSMIIFALSVTTRSIMYTYLATLGLLVGYFISRNVLRGPDFAEISALTDPFMMSALLEVTRTWTAIERNTMLPEMTGLVLQNRLVWGALTVVFAGLTYSLFSFRQPAKQKADKKSKKAEAAEAAEAYQGLSARPVADWSERHGLAQLLMRTKFEMKSVFMSIPFLMIVGFSLLIVTLGLLNRELSYGIEAYPVTRMMIERSTGGLGIAFIVVIIFYSADILWRERSTGMFEIVDATPTPNWVFSVSKLLAMFGVVLTIIMIGIFLAIMVQVLSGYSSLEIARYVERGIFMPAVSTFLVAVLALFVQSLVANRFVGMMIMVVYLILTLILSQFGFEHPLYLYGSGISAPMSDMNGEGRFLIGEYWLMTYWAAFAGLLIVACHLLWRRGTLQPLKLRMRAIPSQAGVFANGLAAVLLAVFVGTGGVIFYNTNILNEYITSDDIEDWRVDYEAKYRQYEDLPQPRITAVDMDVAIYPYQRKVLTSGSYKLVNDTDAAIADIHLSFPTGVDIELADITGGATALADEDFNHHILTLDTPMAAGEERTLSFKTRIEQQGFMHARNSLTLVRNGTFINNFDIAPGIGFNPSLMLQGRNTRRQRGLEPLPRTADLDDESQFDKNYIRQDSDFIDFSTRVSTVEGQVAVAPGYLQKDWVENGRHYFEYAMDKPILNFYSYLSADYEVVREEVDGVAIEVYHHAPHSYNVDRMIDSVRDSIRYFGEAFSPYQHAQMRILEFPAYRSFAQSFPNTVPYSEGIGFIADVSGDNAIDLPYYVTAHEVGHQWWAHQVMAANVQGGTMLIETLAQYSALLVMEEEYGKDQIRKFLKYELDNYLRGRAGDPEGENPLYRVENQAYIHYNKGAVIMYALKDYLGEDVVNRALSRLIQERAFKSKPYGRSVDMLRLLREEAPASQHGIITDFFEKITLYDLTAKDATVSQTEEGYTVSFNASTAKLYADKEGRETKADFDIPVDIGIFRKSPADPTFTSDDVLYLAKHSLADGDVSLTLSVGDEPLFVGIDPYNKLIDRDSDNNLVKIEKTTELTQNSDQSSDQEKTEAD